MYRCVCGITAWNLFEEIVYRPEDVMQHESQFAYLYL